MKVFRSKSFIRIVTLVLVLCFMLGSTGVIAYASNPNNNNNNNTPNNNTNNNTNNTNRLRDTFNDVMNANSGKNQNLTEVEEKVSQTSNSLIDIASRIAFTVLVISCIFTATRFSRVGDNAQKQNMLKVAVALQLLGIIYLANVIGFIDFSFQNLRLF